MGEFKYRFYSLLLVAAFAVENGHTSPLIPAVLSECRSSDNNCTQKALQDLVPYFVKGLPELGLPSLDPYLIPKVSIPLEGLNVTFDDGKISGFKKSVIDKAETYYDKRELNLEFHSNATLKGKYTATGQFIGLPIDGDGDVKIKIKNFKVKLNLKFKLVKGEDGVLHYAIDDYKYDFDYGDRMTFSITNFFKDDPELNSLIVSYINQFWKPLAEVFGKPIIDYAVELGVRTVEKVLLAVPFEDLRVLDL